MLTRSIVALFALFLIADLTGVNGLGQMMGAPRKQKEYANSAEFQQLLKTITKEYYDQKKEKIEILEHSEYTTQVVAGILRRLKIKFIKSGCKDCQKKSCKVKVLEQPWMSPKSVVSFLDCKPVAK